ncbi:MAG TPA: glycosyltransferase, partial [Alphaproteobacteria bacterium]|nr:glycosyltransferase [Alphaproteobacteria bacterium]
PRIGYVGRINRKVDFATIAAVARAKPDWHWVLVGPVQTTGMGAPDQDPQIAESYRASRQLSNVHFLGSKTHTDLPAYVGHMDVNTLCYRPDEGWWRFGSPLKLHEYLATGRPVVGTGLPDLMAFAGVIAVARSTEEWQRALEGALADRSPQAVDVRRDVASANSWDKRVDELEQHLRAMIAGDVDVREPATRSAASAN